MTTDRKQGRMRPFLMAAGVCALSLAGCGQFFTPENGGNPPTTSGNNLYVANPTTTTGTIAGFAVGASKLTVLASSPYAGATGASCVALAPNNNFFYLGTVASGIFLYTTNSNGSLTIANSGATVATGLSAAAMRVDSSGSWLIVVDQLSQQVLTYSIDSTTGLLTNIITNRAGLDPGAPNHVVIVGSNIYVSLGTGGVDILSFNSSTGAVALTARLAPKNTQGGDQGLAFASTATTTYLFVAETGSATNLGLRQLSIGANGALTETTASPFATGLGPSAVLVDATGSFVYVANRTDGTITGYALTAAGALTALTNSPYTTGTNPVDMVEDNTKSFIGVVNNGGSPDLQLFKFDATVSGELDSVASETTGTDPTNPIAIAATH